MNPELMPAALRNLTVAELATLNRMLTAEVRRRHRDSVARAQAVKIPPMTTDAAARWAEEQDDES